MPIRNAKGGITQYALQNWSYIDKKRFMFDWVTLDKELSFEKELIEQGCKVFHLSCRQEDDEVQFRNEMRAIIDDGYDAIHLHTSFWRGFLAEELALAANIPKIIVHAHSTGIDNSNAEKRTRLLRIHEDWKRKFNIGLATNLIACSENASNFLFGEQIPSERIIILRNGIDTRKFEYYEDIREKTRKLLGVENKIVLLQTGRLEYQKNYEFTLDMFADYVKLNQNAVLLIVGHGSMEQELIKKAEPLGDKVKFLGFRSDIPQLLMAADVFLQPSHFEGFSLASIEAQCSGISWLVSEAVPKYALPLSEERLPLHKAVLPLHKAVWIDMLKKITDNHVRNDYAGKQLRDMGWDINDSIKKLENVYSGDNVFVGKERVEF